MRRILIAEKQVNSYGMPWRSDGTCFSFKGPDEHLRPDEIANIGDKSEIESLVISCDLPDYGFISDMVNLQQLYIYSGENLSDLSFIENLICLRHLFIAESHIGSLEPLIRLAAEKSRLYAESPQDFKSIFKYFFEAVCIRSDCLDCDPNDLADIDALRAREFMINNKRAKC